MADMLVRLYDLPDYTGLIAELAEGGVTIRRVLAPETGVIAEWVSEAFHPIWGRECQKAIYNTPVSCFIALENGKPIGFACHDATCRNFFGPTAVLESARGRGIGKALLWVCLHAMAEQGYAYAIIGGVGPVEFYHGAVGAVMIEGSTPGVFEGMLREEAPGV